MLREKYKFRQICCGNYLQLEIQSEGLVRGIEPFSRFLVTAARSAAAQIVFERIANDAQAPARTIREYYQVLEDTMMGRMISSAKFAGPAGRKPTSHGKFYFFDNGVVHALAGITSLAEFTEPYGRALEHLVFTELSAWLSYARDRRELCFWRTGRQTVSRYTRYGNS